jgi:hypothetical protein
MTFRIHRSARKLRPTYVLCTPRATGGLLFCWLGRRVFGALVLLALCKFGWL